MNIKTALTSALLATVLAACGASGGLKPSVFTAPPDYLREFPIGMSEADLLNQVGPPDRIVDLAGHRRLVYQLGRDMGLRTFSYEVSDGKVVDVIYNDQGPANGSTARQVQGK